MNSNFASLNRVTGSSRTRICEERIQQNWIRDIQVLEVHYEASSCLNRQAGFGRQSTQRLSSVTGPYTIVCIFENFRANTTKILHHIFETIRSLKMKKKNLKISQWCSPLNISSKIAFYIFRNILEKTSLYYIDRIVTIRDKSQ